MMLLADSWKDYELIDVGNGEKLERWKDYVLRRPDPQGIWPLLNEWSLWKKPHAHYHRSNRGGGSWEYKKEMPEEWTVNYKELKFKIKPTGFKHTGLFPEQAVNWDWAIDKIQNAKRQIKVLNLFAYTGGASVACAYAGAEEVCHVDASKGMVSWAKENIALSGLADRKVRFIVDDVVKFVQREVRRGRKYDAIIMDPPSYGRGPNGEVWKIEDEIYKLVKLCMDVLSDDPLFFLINSYTSGFSPYVMENILKLTVGNKFEGNIYSGEVGIPSTKKDLVLPCGIFARWER
ncbi:class I SAM-dependent methyltransferase [Peptostreptococcaceae bacterium AGR-M142]